MDRSSGILLPVSALPGPCGIGDLGADARDFIDFLAAAGQRYWQILPLNPPDGAHSPYLSASTFAGSTDLLSPEPFLARGALTAGEVRAIDWGADPMRVDYDRVYAGRTALWDAAFAREKASAAPALRAAIAAEPWLRDYCLYMAVKEEQGGAPWYAWPQPLRDRSAAALAAALERLDDRVLLHAYLQTEFTRQWDAVRAYAHAGGSANGEEHLAMVLSQACGQPRTAAFAAVVLFRELGLIRLENARRLTVPTGMKVDMESSKLYMRMRDLVSYAMEVD